MPFVKKPVFDLPNPVKLPERFEIYLQYQGDYTVDWPTLTGNCRAEVTGPSVWRTEKRVVIYGASKKTHSLWERIS